MRQYCKCWYACQCTMTLLYCSIMNAICPFVYITNNENLQCSQNRLAFIYCMNEPNVWCNSAQCVSNDFTFGLLMFILILYNTFVNRRISIILTMRSHDWIHCILSAIQRFCSIQYIDTAPMTAVPRFPKWFITITTERWRMTIIQLEVVENHWLL